jgi:hypothetical protein
MGAIDFSHPTLANTLKDLVLAKPIACLELHAFVRITDGTTEIAGGVSHDRHRSVAGSLRGGA